MKIDYSLLRPVGTNTPVGTKVIVQRFGAATHRTGGVLLGFTPQGCPAVRFTDQLVDVLSLGLTYLAPITWIDDKPVYSDAVLWHKGQGKRIVASGYLIALSRRSEQNNSVFAWAEPEPVAVDVSINGVLLRSFLIPGGSDYVAFLNRAGVLFETLNAEVNNAAPH